MFVIELFNFTEKLCNLVISELSTIDIVNRQNSTSYLDRFVLFLEEIGIQNSLITEKRSNGSETRYLGRITGQQCLKVMEKIDFNCLYPVADFPMFSQRDEHTLIYKKFSEIFLKLKANYYVDKIDELKQDTELWRKAFLDVEKNHVKEFTPYMHIFIKHTDFFVSRHGDIDLFNCQGLEKLNDHTSTEYFRASNKKR
jgi:hypothetical protein